MIGYTQPNNDLYIFFEDSESERLRVERIQGIYFNLRDPSRVGLLEASVNDKIRDRIKTSVKRDEEGFCTWLLLEMRLREYETFVERRSFELHEGFRHICLRDTSKQGTLSFLDQLNYRQLKYWKSQHSKPKT
ncbi:MAG: hypothetical protein WC494_04260 [Candidatus Pacearchaeota archaeon]